MYLKSLEGFKRQNSQYSSNFRSNYRRPHLPFTGNHVQIWALFCEWISCDSEIVSNATDNVFKKSRRVQASKFTIFFKFPFELQKATFAIHWQSCANLTLFCEWISCDFEIVSNATTMYLKSLEGFKRQNSQYSSNFHSNYRRPHLPFTGNHVQIWPLFCKWISCDSEIVSNAKTMYLKSLEGFKRFWRFDIVNFDSQYSSNFHSNYRRPHLPFTGNHVQIWPLFCMWIRCDSEIFDNATTMYLKSLEGFKRQNSQYSSNFHSNYRRPHLPFTGNHVQIWPLFCKWISCDSEIVSNAKTMYLKSLEGFKRQNSQYSSNFHSNYRRPHLPFTGNHVQIWPLFCKWIRCDSEIVSNATTMYLKSLEGFKRQNSQYSSNFHSNYRRPHLPFTGNHVQIWPLFCKWIRCDSEIVSNAKTMYLKSLEGFKRQNSQYSSNFHSNYRRPHLPFTGNHVQIWPLFCKWIRCDSEIECEIMKTMWFQAFWRCSYCEYMIHNILQISIRITEGHICHSLAIMCKFVHSFASEFAVILKFLIMQDNVFKKSRRVQASKFTIFFKFPFELQKATFAIHGNHVQIWPLFCKWIRCDSEIVSNAKTMYLKSLEGFKRQNSQYSSNFHSNYRRPHLPFTGNHVQIWPLFCEWISCDSEIVSNAKTMYLKSLEGFKRQNSQYSSNFHSNYRRPHLPFTGNHVQIWPLFCKWIRCDSEIVSNAKTMYLKSLEGFKHQNSQYSSNFHSNYRRPHLPFTGNHVQIWPLFCKWIRCDSEIVSNAKTMYLKSLEGFKHQNSQYSSNFHSN